MESPHDSEAWTRLWRAGVLHSCSTGIAGNYDGAIAMFWRARFDQLQDGQRMVDIGTGNGALPLLAKQHGAARNSTFDLHGVDIADVDPRRWAESDPSAYDGIVFHSKTPADRLPFDAGSVALVTSQYAFEYCHPREATIREIFRVIGRQGTAAFLIHSMDSLIASTARDQLLGCALLFDETHILDLAHHLVANLPGVPTTLPPSLRREAMHDAGQGDMQHRFGIASARLVEAAEAMPQAAILRKAMHYLHGTLQRAQRSPLNALEYLAHAREDLESEHVRLRHLSQAIMPMHALEEMHRHCLAAGYASSTLAPIDQGEGNRMGWGLVITP